MSRADRPCSIEDCSTPVGRAGARGLCPKHYNRWRTHGDPLKVLPRGGFHGVLPGSGAPPDRSDPGPPEWSWTLADEATERWLPIRGVEEFYEVSDLGRVRSLPRVDALGRRRGGRVLRGGTDIIGGYQQVSLTPPAVDGEAQPQVSYRVHVLVLETFVGPRPAGMEACHNNGDPRDNRLSNLRWDSRAANREDAIRHRTSLTQRVPANLTPTRPARRPGVCIRGHRLVPPNLTTGKRKRCLACQMAHNRVNDAFRWKGRRLDIDVEAAAIYRSLNVPTDNSA